MRAPKLFSALIALAFVASPVVMAPTSVQAAGTKTEAKKKLTKEEREALYRKKLREQMRQAAIDKAKKQREAFEKQKEERQAAKSVPASTKKPEPKKEVAKATKKKPVVEESTDVAVKSSDGTLFGTLFGRRSSGSDNVATASIDPRDAQTAILAKNGKPYQVDEKYMPQVVAYSSGYAPGTIVIDSNDKFLYLIMRGGMARRYGVAVGREGLGWHGEATIAVKTEWPRWIPTKDMIERDPKQYAKYADGMDGGPTNPLGARAMYLHQGNKDTYIRIHGTTAPWSIGSAASNGCFRMVNEHVIDLYNRVKIGTKVVVL